jgi:hypothetical protein
MTTRSGSAGITQLAEWRYRRLIEAGFDHASADRFAQWDSVDLHEMIQLVERGCPPALAARIMAPLELESPVT